jgi:dTMP kinase
LRIPPATGRERQLDRALALDRLEREDEAFFSAIHAAYDELADAEPERIRTIDAVQPPEDVLRDALAALDDLLPGASQPGLA